MSTRGRPTIDKKTELTYKTIESLRGSDKLFKELSQAASSYQKTALKLSEDGKKLADAFEKVAKMQQGDIAEAIQRIGECIRNAEIKRELLAKSMEIELVKNLEAQSKTFDKELSQFESDYKRARDKVRDECSKLEKKSKDAGKKGPEVLKQTISDLNAKIKEAETIKTDKLRAVLLLERSKFCSFVYQWSAVNSVEIQLLNDEQRFKDNDAVWKSLAASSSTLPAAAEEYIKESEKERTLIQISATGSVSGSYDSGFGDSYGGGGAPPAPPAAYGGGGGYNSNSGGGYGASSYDSLGTATALYDYAGEQQGDLPFYAGDQINITKDDDGSGWMTGELNGVSGIFPTTYVQWN